MRIAIIGSRALTVDISKYIPKETTEIISGGALGIDSLAERYANEHNIPKLIIKPEYVENSFEHKKLIVDIADKVLVIWNTKSRGTKQIIDYALSIGKDIQIVKIE